MKYLPGLVHELIIVCFVMQVLPAWASFGLPDNVLRALHGMGFNEPTPVQAAAVPEVGPCSLLLT